MAVTINASTTAGLVQTADTSGVLALQTAGTTAVTVDASQRVGIGVSSPAKALSVYGGDGYVQMLNASTGTATGDGAFIGVEGGTTALRVVNQENDAISFSTNGLANERMRISSTGDVGIGTTTPARKFHVRQGGVTTLANTNGSLFTDAGNAGVLLGSDNVLGYISGVTAAGTATVSLVLQPFGGTVLINATSAASGAPGSALYANGSIGAQLTYGPMYFSNENNTDNVGRASFSFRRGGTEVGFISTTNTSTSYNTSSDYRLKENIAPMTGALANVARLKPVTYKWKSTGSDGEGFIAHELAEVCPHAVTNEKDAVDENGNPKYQAIDTSFLVATLTAAIQELKAINDTQAETINALTARIVALEGV